MSLRLRLFLSFVAVALVMAALGFVALRQSRQIQNQATDLTRVAIARFTQDRSVGQSLEIEVDAGPEGTWLGDEIEVLTGTRRPKLRGPLQAVDPAAGTLRLFGQSIFVPATVVTEDLPDGGLQTLRAGDRIEVSCSVEADGSWVARKLGIGNLKASNKIKGVVTAVNMDGIAPDSMAISGILILFDSTARPPNPRVELKRIALATRMARLVQDCALAAHRIQDGGNQTFVSVDGEITDAESLLAENAADLIVAVSNAREFSGPGFKDSLGLEATLWLDPLQNEAVELQATATEYLALVETDHVRAGLMLRNRLEPLLVDVLRPLVHGYRLDAEERLATQVNHLSEQAGRTARALMVASGAALFCAMALGWGVWRSLASPLQRVAEAAARIGQGRLDTRIEITSGDELGMLAATLNHMAADLESSTVSIANLDDILESMAGALFVLDGDGVITSANQAAAKLSAREPQALPGLRLSDLCRPASGVTLLPEAGTPGGGDGHMQRTDGSMVPISFSGAALRRGGGPEGGFVWIAQDLSQRIAMEEQLRNSLAEKELLLREVHHRVKNNLQVISSLLAMQGDSIDDPQARSVYADSQARIRSMALIHQQLYGASTLDRIDFGAYLQQLADSLFQFHAGGAIEVAIEAEADSAQLGIDRALNCGLIVNELVTNALKHAFAPDQPGTVRVAFHAAEDCVLTVSDDGTGMIDGTGDPDSLGMSLVNALVEQLAGEMKVTTNPGTTFVITFPREDPA